jgi:CDP-glucose 4,6-dehydratase
MAVDAEFWRDKRVLLTGHTGFKGAWMALWLEKMGAAVTGFALPPPPGESLFAALAPWRGLHSVEGDLHDRPTLAALARKVKPQIVVHMAAQAIVRRSFREPVETFATNVMGTAHLLDAVAPLEHVQAILIVTSDKVYENGDHGRPFREDDKMGGDDPYSASKAAAEQLAYCWRRSFLRGDRRPMLGIARAGNVIGGGDWSEDRLVPDAIRAGAEGRPVMLRYPGSTRPWQFVLDVVSGYLVYAQLLASGSRSAPEAVNFGPKAGDPPLATADLIARLQAAFGWDVGWTTAPGDPLPEKTRLALDTTLAYEALGWRPLVGTGTALDWIAQWHQARFANADMRRVSLDQIRSFEALSLTEARL